jgi:hypothetical protein
MPGGLGPTGFITFAAVKYAGYSAAAWLLNRRYQHDTHSPLLIGLVRTGIGLAAGAAYGAAVLFARFPEGLFFAALIPIRLLEWGLLLRWFYEPQFLATGRAWRWASAGAAWSFALDLVGILTALVVPGGIWIC